ncbi:MAG: hypothetical protein R3B45_07650 [Bdellovibrionota bacterium]
MRRLVNIFGVAMIIATSSSAMAQSSLFGQYVGTMKHSRVNKDQYAKLDFIVSREQGNTLHLMAVLSLYFGDFDSREYVSYHFDQVRYNLVTGELVFDQPDQDVTLITTNFSAGDFEATVRSTVAGDVGELQLVKDGTASPSREIIGPLWGEYKATCDNEVKTLQLQTFRSMADTVRIGNPFGSYEIRGQVAAYSQSLCPNAQARPCVKNNIYAGSYNFYQDQLTLLGQQQRMSCTVVNEDTITCGACTFGRISDETTSLSQTNPRRPSNALVSGGGGGLSGPVSGLSGTYLGYLHHEFLDQYQAGAINIIAYQDPEGSGLRMSATANLYFGDLSSTESLSYRFEERPYEILSRQFVFERASADVDAILQVTHIGDGVVRGIWYSILFGRVGTFEFNRAPLSPLPGNLKPFKDVAGEYESDELELNVAVRMAQTPVNTENPFFPLTFGGYLYYKAGFSRRIDITGGSYDFYTGRLGFTVGDGVRVATGLNMSDEKEIKLKFNSNGFGRLLQSHDLVNYNLMN